MLKTITAGCASLHSSNMPKTGAPAVCPIAIIDLTPWLPWLEREWADGCRNGAELWPRLRAAGFRGSLRVVGEWATRQRRAEGAMPSGMGKTPPARKIARLLTTARDHLCKADAVVVAQVEVALPSLATACALTARFTDMVRNGEQEALAEWLNEAENSALASFARGLRNDQHAVAAALREPWSNGQTEGQINRLKTIKRQMYGKRCLDPALINSPSFSSFMVLSV